MTKHVFKLAVCIMLTLVFLPGVSMAKKVGQEYIAFGADLNQKQRDQLLKQFNSVKQPQMLEVTNSEEYYYVSKYVPKDKIGKRAISSVYLQTLSPGAGIQVQTNQITWVTEGMYANAAVTAGLKDVLIKAAAPFPVSGTAALTGIFKTFEQAQGRPIEEVRKDTAYQEMITTGELGEDVGQRNAEGLIRDVKREVVERKVTNPQEIRVIIENRAKEYNLKLSEAQTKQIQQLMQKINRLDLNVSEINSQLKSLDTKVKGIREQGEKAQGFFAQILNLLQQLLNMVTGLFNR